MTDQQADQAKGDSRICVLLNVGSGATDKDDVEQRILETAKAHGREIDVIRLNPKDGIRRQVEAAVQKGYGTLVAAGGDGTISGVAGVLAGSGRTMGILPQGTFNFVARGLGIPTEVEEAIALILNGTARPFPVGEVNGHVFLNNASLGIYPQVLRQREGVYRRWGRSQIAAHLSVLWTFLTFRKPIRMQVRVGGEVTRLKTPLAFVGRSAFQLDHYGLEGADAVRDGEFALYVAPDSSKVQLLMRALRLASAGMVLDRDFQLFTGTEIDIETPRKHQLVAMDGERTRLKAPFKFRMRPDALHVIAPDQPDMAQAGDRADQTA